MFSFGGRTIVVINDRPLPDGVVFTLLASQQIHPEACAGDALVLSGADTDASILKGLTLTMRFPGLRGETPSHSALKPYHRRLPMTQEIITPKGISTAELPRACQN